MRLALCALLLLLPAPAPAWRSDTVKAWSRALGEELWGLKVALTKSDQIKAKYKEMNASVKRKNGRQILDSSLESVATMLTKKINAVKCIHATAKQLVREFQLNNETVDANFTYCSAKYSNFTYEDGSDLKRDSDKLPNFVKKEQLHYLPSNLERDSHFYNISVNTNISCVHVPTNIYFLETEAQNAIVWSKGLNDIFTRNYQADPSLAWQYFGTANGILRFYPGMPWNMKETDIYDCRVQSWYIEAATCSKDIIVLFDVSGSMTGFKNYVARTTLKSLLDTLSNNDYVNVYAFKNDTHLVMNCSEGLVQATKENIGTILHTLTPTDGGKKHKILLEGNANLTKAYIKAFEMLKVKRVESKCNVSSPLGCNQLVMLITDYVPGNLSEVFDEYNREVVDGKTYIPVRVFTYLIGKEVTNVAEITSMACNNRGYHVHIHSVEEVQQQVLKYINVIARPMILDGSPPPPTWTHASIDATRTKTWGVISDISKHDEDKLVTSVAIPAFDSESNQDAILIGVAGTDVPIDSIAKLGQPHQLGVNGYSFIVSNNGYLLLHPLLKTSINEELQVNYNSVDFVEVEQVDDGKGARELGDKILGLRQNLTDGDDGNMTDVEVLFHYDDMRRISRVKHDYYFRGLNETPFSMGISLPKGYGDTELMLKDNPLEATQGQSLTGINVTDYFKYSYRVHPDWVYCKYHYLEGHESDNPEIEIWKFLVNISKNLTDISKKQYTKEASETFSVETHCGDAKTKLGKDDYYCNEDLVKQLVFDAKLSAPYFQEWTDHTAYEEELAKKYNVSVRFIMTSSGLTRWHYLYDDDKNEQVNETGSRLKNFGGKVLGDHYSTTIEVTPYKAAVLQSTINRESLVVATPLPVLDTTIVNPTPVIQDGDITITASYAIFYKDSNIETPASVVGFQFSYLHFRDRFMKIIESVDDKSLSCNNKDYECYVIDSSGYIVLSMAMEEVGQFFGMVQPYVLKSFIEKKIFEHVEVFNYQALCPLSILKQSANDSWLLDTPWSLIKWFLTELLLIVSDIYSWNTYTHANSIVEDAEQGTTNAPPKNEKAPPGEKTFSCDHSITLYILNQTHFLKTVEASPIVYEEKFGKCHPPYWASYVKNTNLLLVVVEKNDNAMFDDDQKCLPPPMTNPVPTNDSIQSSEPCHKLNLAKLPRRRLEGCFTYHEGEANLPRSACGRGTTAVAEPRAVALTTLLVAVAYRLLLHG
ncbi:ca[2+] channel Muscle-specific alpha2/delta subunit [Choristoneura fumiferana]|uniref:ca[2+] channel Muscle-specific alpha2/delta subunit n=1 Tax=Choristoneura fumiferana TaxID=7141 RepID=UPI003D15DB80